MNKKNIAMILSVVMTASVMLAGCGKKADVPAADSTVSSSATGETATGESATPETSTETVTVDYGVGLKKTVISRVSRQRSWLLYLLITPTSRFPATNSI